jgi:UDP-N-acetylmuramoyl-tripeptide--D-alanyl-D-alanine ligase
VGVSGTSLAEIVKLAGGRLDEDDFPTNLDLSHTKLISAPSGAIILADTDGATSDSMAASLKMLVQVAGQSRRSIAVLGELDVEPNESPIDVRDEHDGIGRLVVRLNVQKLIVVGHEARHIHNAAGLEGSWDGESELVASPDEAYDLLREDVGSGDIVLVKSSARTQLGSLVSSLGGVLA